MANRFRRSLKRAKTALTFAGAAALWPVYIALVVRHAYRHRAPRKPS